MSKLLYNRLHLTAIDSVVDKYSFYVDGLKSAAAYSENEHAYKIIDLVQSGDYILGYLTKYDPYGKGEYLDEKTGTAVVGGTKNNIIGKSLFIINVKEALIAFEEVPSVISKHQFRRIFVGLFKINHEGKIIDLSISGVSEKYSFIEQVKTLTEVNKIKISLVPSNPRNADLWKDTDERMREGGITKYTEVQESKLPNGIKIDTETIGKMAMAEDGYGESEAQGKDAQGHVVSINTKQRKQELTQVLPNSVESKGTISILAYVKNTFKSIADRTKKG